MSNNTKTKRAKKKKEQARKSAQLSAKKSGSGGLKRKIIRSQQRLFMKHFRKTMSEFKRQVACSKCGREPREGEKIDDWHIDKYSDKIDLICTDCYTKEESEEINEDSTEL